MEKKLFSWKANYLSIGGRATLIKAALANLQDSQFITFVFSILKCPISIINQIEKLKRDFSRHGRRKERKLHLVDWASICRPKEEGGLGIRPQRQMNQA